MHSPNSPIFRILPADETPPKEAFPLSELSVVNQPGTGVKAEFLIQILHCWVVATGKDAFAAMLLGVCNDG